jgi:hypothetical protein
MSKLKEAAQVALEALRPFAWDSGFEKQWKAFEILDHAIKNYTGMEDGQVREWVGLTDEERNRLWCDCILQGGYAAEFARAIEAKLKEKNT